MELGEKIKILREKAGLTQEELAHEVGVQRNTVWRWENGRANLTSETLQRLSSVLKTGTLDLMSVNTDQVNRDYVAKKRSTHEEEEKGAIEYTLVNGEKLKIPATPYGYSFLENLLSKKLLGNNTEIKVKEMELA